MRTHVRVFTAAFSLVAAQACTAGAPIGTGVFSAGQRARLTSIGVADARLVDGSIILYGDGSDRIGEVEIQPDDGFDVVVDGFGASLAYHDGRFHWRCDDGHSATGPAHGPGLITMLEYDPTLRDGPCARAVAAGWIVAGAFRAPPAGCVRVAVGDEARLECEESDIGGAHEALLASCDDGGGGGWGGWGGGCTNTGTGCAPECASCFAASGAALCEGGGGGGGGSQGWCSQYNTNETLTEYTTSRYSTNHACEVALHMIRTRTCAAGTFCSVTTTWGAAQRFPDSGPNSEGQYGCTAALPRACSYSIIP